MDILVVLFPLALGLGLAGLAAFFWCMRSGQFVDLEGPGWRVLSDEDLRPNPPQAPRAAEPSAPNRR
ncbi:MAG: cbb3-type cytochrome oxidase assembly protein CcoS [Bosea sp. (in: a-proteobacteria)]